MKRSLVAPLSIAGLCVAMIGAIAQAFSVTPTLPPGYVQCAGEGGMCAITAPTSVVFGAPGGYTSPITVSSSITCNGVTFGGDPNPKIVKACFASELGVDQQQPAPAPNPTPPATGLNTVPAGFVQCAAEGGTCTPLAGPAQIIYGAQGSYTAPVVMSAATPCTSGQFKGDPAPHFVKACFSKTIGPPPTPPACPAILTWGWYDFNLSPVLPEPDAIYSDYLPNPAQCVDQAQTRTWIDHAPGNQHVQGWCTTKTGIEGWYRFGAAPQPTAWPAPPTASVAAK